MANLSCSDSSSSNSTTLYKESELPAEILERFRKFRDGGKFCDVTLLVNGEELHAHKALLAACSPYFASVLRSSHHRTAAAAVAATESGTDVTGSPADAGASIGGERLLVPVGNARAFKSVLAFIYTGSISIDAHNMLDLLTVANVLLLFKLKAFIAEVIESMICSSNVLAVREAAIKYYLPDLHLAATEFIRDNLKLVRPALLRLDFVKLKNLILDKRLNINRSSRLASLIVAWVCYRFKERAHLLRFVLCLVDWSRLSPEQVVTLAIKRPQAKELLPAMLSIFGELKNHESAPPEIDLMATRMKLEQTAVDAAIQDLAHQDDEQALDFIEDASDCDEDGDDGAVSNGVSRQNAGSVAGHSTNQMSDGNTCSNGAIPVSDKTTETGCADSTAIACERCAFIARGEPAKMLLRSHIEAVHTRQITYKCFLCGFTCTWKPQFLDHLKRTHFPRSPPYRCDGCELRTARLSTLLRHRRRHLSLDRPLSCDRCTYRCRLETQLANHCRLHDVDRPHVCRWCRRSFIGQHALDVHLKRVHPAERYLRCERCTFRTRYPQHLATHRRMHLNAGGGSSSNNNSNNNNNDNDDNNNSSNNDNSNNNNNTVGSSSSNNNNNGTNNNNNTHCNSKTSSSSNNKKIHNSNISSRNNNNNNNNNSNNNHNSNNDSSSSSHNTNNTNNNNHSIDFQHQQYVPEQHYGPASTSRRFLTDADVSC